MLPKGTSIKYVMLLQRGVTCTNYKPGKLLQGGGSHALITLLEKYYRWFCVPDRVSSGCMWGSVAVLPAVLTPETSQGTLFRSTGMLK